MSEVRAALDCALLADYAERLGSHVGGRGDIVIGADLPTLRQLAAALREAHKEVDRCHRRLEIDHCYMDAGDGKGLVRVEVPYKERRAFPDGISCRDDSIKLLEDRCNKPHP